MNIQTDNWLISRRRALRGLGVSMALPLLDCMIPSGASAAEKKRLAPRRSAFFYIPNGVNTLDYQILQAGAYYTFSKSLKPLEKHRAVITPISGLYHPNGLGHHHNCRNIFLTGGKLGPSDRNTISVDQLMAQVTSPHTRYPSLEMFTQGGSLAWNADGISLPGQNQPGHIFKDLFQEPKGGIAKQRRGLHRRGSILDAVIDEADDLSKQLGKDDRGRLEQYLTSVRETEIRTERADEWLDISRPKIDAEDASRLNRTISAGQLGDYLRTMYDVIILAFQTDMTRVATFSTGVEGQGPSIPEIGITQDRHSLSHHNGNPKMLAGLTASDTFNIEQFAYFIERLSTVSDANGPLIDTTMALYGSGMAFGHSHGNANLPLVLAGGSKLGIKHGAHVDYNRANKDFKGYNLVQAAEHYRICTQPVNEKARMSNLLLTMAQKMGVQAETFADSNGVISEIV